MYYQRRDAKKTQSDYAAIAIAVSGVGKEEMAEMGEKEEEEEEEEEEEVQNSPEARVMT